jgi:hypothetical protein
MTYKIQILWVLIGIILSSCSSKPISKDPFVVILVDAPHLNYSSTRTLFKSLVKHPETANKDGYVGHAWVYVRGAIDDGPLIEIEGGHSGELGKIQPKYFDGVMNMVEYGLADPTAEEKRHPAKEKNPIKYLWTTQHDGFFQQGTGKHIPNYAAKVALTTKQFERIVQFIKSGHYCFSEYSITKNQCSTFVAQVAALAGLPLQHEITLTIPNTLTIGKETLPFWQDPIYSQFTFSTPDIVEKSLRSAVERGDATPYLKSYLKQKGILWKQRKKWAHRLKTLMLFPTRLKRIFLHAHL